MKESTWVLEHVILRIHDILLAEHGGGTGIRDLQLLKSAIAKPIQKYHYQDNVSIFDIAAAYSFGLAKNHPFVDGNKRTAFTVGVVFLGINGYHLNASEAEAAVMFENLAAGTVDERDLASWFEQNYQSPKNA